MSGGVDYCNVILGKGKSLAAVLAFDGKDVNIEVAGPFDQIASRDGEALVGVVAIKVERV